MNMEFYLQQGLAKESFYSEALEIARENSSGKLWLVGGAVYRTVIAGLYGIPKKVCDFDFLTEEIHRQIFLPEGWKLSSTTFGNPRFSQLDVLIDLFSLSQAIHWDDQGKVLTPDEKLESYFRRVPLDIQAISYDVDQQLLIGEKGLRAIKEKVITVNCQRNLDEYLPRKRISLEEYISSKATSLGFAYQLP